MISLDITALDLTTAIIGALVLVGFAVLVLADQRAKRKVQPVTPVDDRAWIDQRIAAETDPGKRAAWRMIRDREEQL